MLFLRGARSLAVKAARGLVFLLAGILVVAGIAIGAVETAWGKEQLRRLIVRQANAFLTATLDIGRVEGSLFRGIELHDLTLSQDGRPIVAIDAVNVSYSPRELFEGGTVIRRLALTRPRIVAAKQPDGRWNLGSLVRRNATDRERTGPRRRIEIQEIEIVDGNVSLRDPFKFGPANIPTEFAALNASFAFQYAPVRWTLAFQKLSFVGTEPDLTMHHLGGAMGRSADGWFFDHLSVRTPQSAFVVDGQVVVGDRPTVLDLTVRADKFAFQEWSGLVTGLRSIAVDSAFETTLKGRLEALDTQLSLSGTGGSVNGRLTLNTRVPGWHGTGAVDVVHIDLARWFNRSDRPSDINGHLTFDLDLDLGKKFPRGTYEFSGSRTTYMNYSAETLQARGRLIPGEALIDGLNGVAYGATMTSTTGSIGLDSPFPYRFKGTMSRLDLRRVPEEVPVPHVESTLALEYDARGQFSQPFITARGRFHDSRFLGATVVEGTTGSIDTASRPTAYAGQGGIRDVDLNRFGDELDVGWLKDPRYRGNVSGSFRVAGTTGDAEALTVEASGRFDRAELFRGTISNADVSMRIEDGTLQAAFSGRLASVDPAIAFDDARFSASLTGSADIKTTVRDLLLRTPSLADYTVEGRMALENSVVRDITLDRAATEATLRGGVLELLRTAAAGPVFEGTGSGTVALDTDGETDFVYDFTRIDLAKVPGLTNGTVAGQAITKGRLSGPSSTLRAAGTATITNLTASGFDATSTTGDYDLVISSDAADAPLGVNGKIDGRATFLNLFGQPLQEATGTASVEKNQARFDLVLTKSNDTKGDIDGSILVHPDRHGADVQELTVTIGSMPWRLLGAAVPPSVRWDDAGITVSPVTFATGHEDDQRIEVSGTWRYDGNGRLNVTGRHVFLETLQNTQDRPARYGGVVDLDAVVRGTADDPIVNGTLTVSSGRVERISYEKLAGRVDYSDDMVRVDVRLDEAPGTWLTARGTIPRGLFDDSVPDRAIDLTIASSSIDLALLVGITDVVTRSSGQLQLDVHVGGTSDDPHFEGTVGIAGAAFTVADTGVAYRNGRAALRLAPDIVTVDSIHLEDAAGRTLDMRGSLGTHELRLGDVAIDLTTNRFEVLRNEFGRLDVTAKLAVTGRAENPRIAGDVTLNGTQLNVDQILDRFLFRPYSTEPASMTSLDAVAALNPWDRLGLDIALHVPQTLRLAGSDIQVSPGTPIGLGDINLRVGGDLYLYKDPGGPVYPTGSLDRVAGTYVFQGRRFDIDEPSSSINFVGDSDPQIWIMVTRDISGVQTRVTVNGSLRQPQLVLASTPPLDESDILSLIVFNTTQNALTVGQQEELAVRAGTIAAGFLAQPLLQAVQKQLGLETLQIETAAGAGAGPRLTVGGELAPGLVARFSRQFGQEEYDEATIEFFLSRMLRLRATFSDAQSVIDRSVFRRLDRAGIDLLVFFSF